MTALEHLARAGDTARAGLTEKYVRGMELLVTVVQELALARDLDSVMAVVRTAARRLTGADGATFVLRDGDLCHYADEDAIEPLWKGNRFPMSICVSGWVMLNREPAIIPDVFADPRVPADVYRPTFVKSLVMVPIRTLDPVGAIGNYWATSRQPTAEEVRLLQALADTTAVAVENVRVWGELEQRVRDRTAELDQKVSELEASQRQADRIFSALTAALPGRVLDGKYCLGRLLGRGGFGAVYQATRLEDDRLVAVKVFRPSRGNDSADAVERFFREGQWASRVRHPNAVTVLDQATTQDGIAYLVMELLQGHTLEEELRRHGPFPVGRCAELIVPVCAALSAAHARGVIHRDVKPANVFLHRSEAGAEVIKVLDFGLARGFGEQTSLVLSRLTAANEVVGTPVYIAPERLSGGGDGPPGDVYSLGVMLHEMLTARLPPRAMDSVGGLMLGWGATTTVGPQLPEEVADVVRRAVKDDPAQRPSLAELAEAFEAARVRAADEELALPH